MRIRDVHDDTNAITRSVVDAAFSVHNTFGPGLLERAYHEFLKVEIQERGHRVESEVVVVPVVYKNRRIEAGYRVDLIVDQIVLVEVKALSHVLDLHFAQTWTYLKLMGCPVGLLINFNTRLIRDGIHRMVNL
jgi:GxxExxY protein